MLCFWYIYLPKNMIIYLILLHLFDYYPNNSDGILHFDLRWLRINSKYKSMLGNWSENVLLPTDTTLFFWCLILRPICKRPSHKKKMGVENTILQLTIALVRCFTELKNICKISRKTRKKFLMKNDHVLHFCYHTIHMFLTLDGRHTNNVKVVKLC